MALRFRTEVEGYVWAVFILAAASNTRRGDTSVMEDADYLLEEYRKRKESEIPDGEVPW